MTSRKLPVYRENSCLTAPKPPNLSAGQETRSSTTLSTKLVSLQLPRAGDESESPRHQLKETVRKRNVISSHSEQTGPKASRRTSGSSGVPSFQENTRPPHREGAAGTPCSFGTKSFKSCTAAGAYLANLSLSFGIGSSSHLGEEEEFSKCFLPKGTGRRTSFSKSHKSGVQGASCGAQQSSARLATLPVHRLQLPRFTTSMVSSRLTARAAAPRSAKQWLKSHPEDPNQDPGPQEGKSKAHQHLEAIRSFFRRLDTRTELPNPQPCSQSTDTPHEISQLCCAAYGQREELPAAPPAPRQ